MKPVLEQSEHPLTAKDLEELEARLGRPLPPAFKEYYLCYNGGYLPEDREGNALIVGGFDSIRYGRLPAEQLYADLLESFEQLELLFPFAYDQGGNNFLISLRDQPDYGSIYIWLMDLQELELAAESFGNFLDFLQEE
ncbi:SMI1/KNR4 family protein [Paenibacillus wulumuqiensis]|uniref:SMI1/KNR4 family protein n=1 Tax=Paenibacillus wulumuqiensis TaxID=1567107 RepID=UPI00061967BE|nr:SMI1/KNR4 family protein [Paenibacillus wulumuqiensis]